MPTKDEAIRKWLEYLRGKADVEMHRYALTGDGSNASTCDVAGRPGWAWVRYDEKQDKASQVANQVMPGAPQGVPVVIGKKYPQDKYYQILGINMELYYEHSSPPEYSYYLLPKHGETHQYESSDPAWITLGNLLPGNVTATTPVTMFVSVNSLTYDYLGVAQTYVGGTIDLTATVPPWAGTHRFVLVTINPASNTLAATSGDAAPSPVTPGIPAVPMGHVPLAVVNVANGISEIPQSEIYQYKLLFGSVGGYWAAINDAVATLELEMDWELTRFRFELDALGEAIAMEELERDFEFTRHIM